MPNIYGVPEDEKRKLQSPRQAYLAQREQLSAGDVGDRERAKSGTGGLLSGLRSPFRPSAVEEARYERAGAEARGEPLLAPPSGLAIAGGASAGSGDPFEREAAIDASLTGRATPDKSVGYDKAGLVPENIQRVGDVSELTDKQVFKNDLAAGRPDQVAEYGKAIYADSSYGARPEGFEEQLRKYGTTLGPGGASALSPPAAAAGPAADLLTPAAEATGSGGAGGAGGTPKAAGVPLAQPPAHRTADSIQKREARMALGQLMDDIKRGRITGKEALALMPAFMQNQGAVLGLSEKDAAALLSADYSTAQRAATDAAGQGTDLEAEGMRQAGLNKRQRLEQASLLQQQQLPRPSEYSAQVLTDTNAAGDQTERLGVFDKTTGQVLGQQQQAPIDPVSEARMALAKYPERIDEINERLAAQGYPTL